MTRINSPYGTILSARKNIGCVRFGFIIVSSACTSCGLETGSLPRLIEKSDLIVRNTGLSGRGCCLAFASRSPTRHDQDGRRDHAVAHRGLH